MNSSTKINRSLLYSGLVTLIFFTIILFVLIPLYIEEPGFMPPLAVKSDTWPKTIAILGMVMGVLLIFNAWTLAQPATDEDDNLNNDNKLIYLARFSKILLSFIVFVIIEPYLGFLISTILLTVFLMSTIQSPANYIKSIIIGLVFTLLIYFVFTKFIHVQFPLGEILKGLF